MKLLLPAVVALLLGLPCFAPAQDLSLAATEPVEEAGRMLEEIAIQDDGLFSVTANEAGELTALFQGTAFMAVSEAARSE